jgi:hypothetical protein
MARKPGVAWTIPAQNAIDTAKVPLLRAAIAPGWQEVVEIDFAQLRAIPTNGR